MLKTPASAADRVAKSWTAAATGVCTGLVAVLFACGPTTQPVSTTKHDLNTPVRDASVWNWHKASRADYAAIMAPLLGLSAGDIVAASDPLVVKQQAWLDRIDASLRQQHPDQLANVPKPQAMVLKSATPNAFVAPVSVCYKVPVAITAAAASPATTIDSVFLDIKTGQLDTWPPELSCLDGGAGAQATLASIVARFNASSSSGCQMSLDGGTLSLSDACSRTDALGTAVAAKSVVILETANFVTTFAGIVPIMSEPEFVSVLAHELGHYYRSHITATEGTYDFFYTLLRDQENHKPVAEAGRAQLGKAAVASSTLLNSTTDFTAIAGQQLRSELFFTVGSLVEQLCQDGSCPASCASAKTLLDSTSFLADIARFPIDGGSSAQTAAYGRFETRALACLADVQLAAGSAVLTANTVSWDALVSLAAAPQWPTWLGQLSPRGQQTLATLNGTIAARLGQTAPQGSSLKELVLVSSAAFNTQDVQGEQILKQAHDTRLGQYTIEQEADDEGTEFIAGLGLDPETAAKAMDSLGLSIGASGAADGLGGFLLGQTNCDALYRNHWLSGDGSYAFVPVGNFAEIHHSICYRMFNIDREIKAHNEAAAPVSLPAMGGQSWTDLQNEATSLGAASGGGGGFAPQATKLVKATGLLECTFAFGLK